MSLITRRISFLLLVSFCLGLSCKEEEVTTSFHGTVSRNSDGKPAVSVRLIFTGLHSDGGLWPSVTEVSTHEVVTDAAGNFSITIPENSEIHRFRLQARSLSSDHIDIVSGCMDWMCEHFPANTSTELTVVVGL